MAKSMYNTVDPREVPKSTPNALTVKTITGEFINLPDISRLSDVMFNTPEGSAKILAMDPPEEESVQLYGIVDTMPTDKIIVIQCEDEFNLWAMGMQESYYTYDIKKPEMCCTRIISAWSQVKQNFNIIVFGE